MAGKLLTDDRSGDADGLYAKLIAAHRDLTDEQSLLVNARLILLLANHIGDTDVLDEAIGLARALPE